MSTMDSRCRRCGEESFAPGTIHSIGGCTFLPDHVKFLSMETSQVKLRARMCTVCGAVELIGDVAKLERIQAEAAAAQP
jgi:ribosomal protein S27AE